jgi:aryl-phospho-beta-D-glucosidase BglC (GH1 family)
MKKYLNYLLTIRIVSCKMMLLVGLLAAAGCVSAQKNLLPDPPIVRGFVGRLSDVPGMKEWGANVVRVFGVGRSGSLEPEMQKLRELGFKAVIVGGMGETDWSQPGIQERLVKQWKETATRMLPYRDVIWGYDLINEPLDRKQLPYPPKEWRGIAIKIIEAIRAIDDKTWIIYEPGPGGRFLGFKNLEPLPDKHVIYSGHYYFPHEFTHAGVRNLAGTQLTEAMKNLNVTYPVKISDLKGSNWGMDIFTGPPLNLPPDKCTSWDKDFQKLILQSAVEFQKKYNVPIYVGEFSTVRWGDVTASIRYLREAIELFEEFGWSWSYHAFNGFTGWNAEHPEGKENYWMQGMEIPKPATTETQRSKLLKKAFKKNSKL